VYFRSCYDSPHERTLKVRSEGRGPCYAREVENLMLGPRRANHYQSGEHFCSLLKPDVQQDA
jgi:hypothetical protein